MSTEPGIPTAEEYDAYFFQYLKYAADEQDIMAVLQRQVSELKGLVESTPDEDLVVAHEPYTWTITQAIGHLVDQERIFGNRAARFASGDTTSLPGYDQNVIANNAGYERCRAADIASEFEHLRCSNLLLFRRLTPEQWQSRGLADEKTLSVRAIAYLLAGHLTYHMNIFRNRLSAGS